MSKNSTATANVIPFRSKELLLVDNGGHPFVPMKPVVEGMGLDWKTQHRKMGGGRFGSTMVIMTIVAQDGKGREMVCLPLRKLPGWLMSIHASKVRPELRDNVIAFQNECDDVLWSYWNEGLARNPRKSQPKALPNGLSIEQRDAVKAMVKARVEVLPKDKQAKAAITCWSAIKSKFGCSYKEISPDLYTDVVSLVARVELEGEYIERGPTLMHRRWLVSFDHNGNEQLTPVPDDAYVLSHAKLLEHLAAPGGSLISTEDLFNFVSAAVDRLKSRAAWQAKQAMELKKAAS